MRNLLRRAPAALPGLVGTLRVDRRVRSLLPRLRPGDIAVIDLLDLDAQTAQALVRARVAAVVNAGAIVSGRYPTLGPDVLVEAGIEILDQVGRDGFDVLAQHDGQRVRVHDGAVLRAGAEEDEIGLASGRELDRATLTGELARARQGLVLQLESLDRDGSQLIEREQDLLLHGQGLPALTTKVAGRPVVVVAPGPDLDVELRGLRHYLKEQRPVVVAVDSALAAARRHGLRPDVAVLSVGAAANGEPGPAVADLAGVRDVVVRLAPGDTRDSVTELHRQGAGPLSIESAVASADLALLLVHAAEPTVIVGVGVGRTVEQLIDARGSGGASHVPTRLRVGPSLVDAASVGRLYAGRVRPRHVLLVLLVGLLALGLAVATTPVGQDWFDSLGTQLQDLWTTVRDQVSGLW